MCIWKLIIPKSSRDDFVFISKIIIEYLLGTRHCGSKVKHTKPLSNSHWRYQVFSKYSNLVKKTFDISQSCLLFKLSWEANFTVNSFMKRRWPGLYRKAWSWVAFHFCLGTITFIPSAVFVVPAHLPSFYNMLEHNVLQNTAFIKGGIQKWGLIILLIVPLPMLGS